MAAPKGNQNAAKSRLVTDAIRKSIVQNKGVQLRKGVKALMKSFADGEPWAIEQVMNRLEGKPAQAVSVEGAGENGEHLIQVIRRVIVDPKP